jgi:hypothetical protein
VVDVWLAFGGSFSGPLSPQLASTTLAQVMTINGRRALT